jgi:hypothetical protein
MHGVPVTGALGRGRGESSFRPHDPAIREVIGETYGRRFEDLSELGDRVRRGSVLVAPQGFEPRYAAPEAAVLPLLHVPALLRACWSCPFFSVAYAPCHIAYDTAWLPLKI